MAEKTYPKMPISNWWSLRTQFQKTIPSAVTVSYLKSLLNLTSEKAAGNLIFPLKQLGLIDDNFKPTQRANDWRSDAKYADACKEMVAEIYPQEMLDLFPGPELDRKSIKEWFMHTATLGEGAADQAASMYVLLNQGMPQNNDVVVKKPKGSTTKIEKNTLNGANANAKSLTRDITEKTTPVETKDVLETKPIVPTVHIDLQIHISPDADPVQIDAIFASMAKHLYKQ